MGLHHIYFGSTIQGNAFQIKGPRSFFRLWRTISAFRCGLRCRVRLMLSGLVLWCGLLASGSWMFGLRLRFGYGLRLAVCIAFVQDEYDGDPIIQVNLKIYKMSLQKQITLNQNDYNNITKSFFFYLENEKDLNLTQNEINSILQTNSKIQ